MIEKLSWFVLGIHESDSDITTNMDHLDLSVRDGYEYGRSVGMFLRGREPFSEYMGPYLKKLVFGRVN